MTPDFDELDTENFPDVLHVLEFIYHNHFCFQNAITEEDKYESHPLAFLTWVDEHFDELPIADIVSTFKLDEEFVDHVRSFVDQRELILSVCGPPIFEDFTLMALSSRPPLVHKIRDIGCTAFIRFEDGSAGLTSIVFPKSALDSLPVADDQLVLMALNQAASTIVNNLMREGTDRLHGIIPPVAPDVFKRWFSVFVEAVELCGGNDVGFKESGYTILRVLMTLSGVVFGLECLPQRPSGNWSG